MPDRILVVGAGPTGLTAGVELRRLGIDAVVIDRKAEPSPLSRAVGILPGSMDILAPSGAAEAIRADAIPIERALFHYGPRRIGRLDLAAAGGARLLGLAQDRTEAHLADAFRRLRGDLRFGAELETLRQDASGVRVRVSGREEAYSHVVGADGVHSRVREELGLAFAGYDLPDDWSIADVDAEDWPDPTAFQVFLLEGGHGVIVVPLEEARFRVISNMPDALAALPVPMRVRQVRRTDSFRISVRQVERYRVGRVFLAGDAAHCHSPVGGRGMNLGIADAADLATRLAAGDVSGYEAARHAEGARTIALSEDARRTILVPRRGRRLLIRAALGLVSALPPLQRRAARRILDV